MNMHHRQNNKPWLSIIVPVRNEALCVSLMSHVWAGLNQLNGVEVIVVDGQSTDGSYERLIQHDVQVLQAQPGRSHQMNKGAEVAQGQMLWFMHCDTWPEDFDYQGAIQAIRRHVMDVGQVSPVAWGRFDIALGDPGLVFKMISFCMNFRSRLTGISTGDQGLFMAKSLWQKVKGFPPGTYGRCCLMSKLESLWAASVFKI